jgi:6-methylsalicylate decarboxylase
LRSLVDRVSGFAKVPFTHRPFEDVDATLARLYYDLAGTPFPHSVRGLLGIAQVEHLLYASDTPFTPANSIDRAARALVETELLDEEQKARLFRENARALFPGSPRHPPSAS